MKVKNVNYADPLLNARLAKFEHKKGYLVYLGCGKNKQPEFVGVDSRSLPGVDIVHNLEVFPWPFADESCHTLVAKHVIEHIKPWLMIDFMNEAWRVLKVDGQFAFSLPYGWSRGFLQDPTHCNACNEDTWRYFDPDYPELYLIYEPKPWRIETNLYQVTGNMEVILKKRHPLYQYSKFDTGEKEVTQ